MSYKAIAVVTNQWAHLPEESLEEKVFEMTNTILRTAAKLKGVNVGAPKVQKICKPSHVEFHVDFIISKNGCSTKWGQVFSTINRVKQCSFRRVKQ